MQVECFKEDSITFKITNEGDDAVNIFFDILKKCRTQANKKGFSNMFNSEERGFIVAFTNKVQGEEIFSEKAYIDEIKH